MRPLCPFNFIVISTLLSGCHCLLRGESKSDEDDEARRLMPGQRQLAPNRLNTGNMSTIIATTTTTAGTMTSLSLNRLGQCQNPCQSNSDCRDGLVCFERTAPFQEAPGCGNAAWNPYPNNYCVLASLVPNPPPTPPPPPAPTPTGSSISLTEAPRPAPTSIPEPPPTAAPELRPVPTPKPSPKPTPPPTARPTPQPTAPPTLRPTSQPTPSPTVRPTPKPTPQPMQVPTTTFEEGSLEKIISNLRRRLGPYALDGGDAFEDPESYQSRAVRRTASIVGIETVSDVKLTQFLALFCVFEATNSASNWVIEADSRFASLPGLPGWINNKGWVGTERDISVLDPCNGWYGVTCDSDRRVTRLQLASNRLTGAFPPEVVLLASDGAYGTGAGNLQILDVSNNEFLTSMSADSFWWWQHLGSNIAFFFFSETSFGGNLATLPKNLVDFDCSYTLLSGGLDGAIFQGLNELQFLNLDGNFFNAPIPHTLASLPKLRYLFASNANIRGTLSYLKQQGGMPSLVEHWIDFNPSLRGTIPTELGRVTTLRSLSLTKNALVGTMPTELGLLTNLRQMWLSGNNLYLEIPTQLGRLSVLQTLQLEGNLLSGSMPSQVCANYDGGTFRPLRKVGADCASAGGTVDCACCTCCSYDACK